MAIAVPEEVVAAVELIESVVTFGHDSAEVTENYMEAVRTVSTWMDETPEARLTVSGHTDATGTEAYNYDLSEERARIVGTFLSVNGVEEGRIDLKWFGEANLAVDTTERESANRRVVITPSLPE